ncbi:hypothetical protein QBC42DRAFT_257107 [Cladorrhinum samala]|uniref:Uncharacterized protein n=1 Tax=Cladorrhinum samala TaxID=585594 RepID=A0AAV9HA24_9PEZI|nr:hypothetical protein QBC42DRAFT_257107 [Cladorrhinum samala]
MEQEHIMEFGGILDFVTGRVADLKGFEPIHIWMAHRWEEKLRLIEALHSAVDARSGRQEKLKILYVTGTLLEAQVLHRELADRAKISDVSINVHREDDCGGSVRIAYLAQLDHHFEHSGPDDRFSIAPGMVICVDSDINTMFGLNVLGQIHERINALRVATAQTPRIMLLTVGLQRMPSMRFQWDWDQTLLQLGELGNENEDEMGVDGAPVVDTDIWPQSDSVYRPLIKRDHRELLECLKSLQGAPRVLFFGPGNVSDSLAEDLHWKQTTVYKGDGLEDVEHLFRPATEPELVRFADGAFVNPLPIRDLVLVCSFLRSTPIIDPKTSLAVSRVTLLHHLEATMQHAYATSPLGRKHKVRLLCAYARGNVGRPQQQRCYTLVDNVCKNVFVAMSKWPAFAHCPLVLQVPDRRLLGSFARRICKIGLAWQEAPAAGAGARFAISDVGGVLLRLKSRQPSIFKKWDFEPLCLLALAKQGDDQMSEAGLRTVIRLATLVAKEKDITVKIRVARSAAFEDEMKRTFPEWASLMSRGYMWRLLAVWALGYDKTGGQWSGPGRTKKSPDDVEVLSNIKLDALACIEANKDMLALEKEFGLKTLSKKEWISDFKKGLSSRDVRLIDKCIAGAWVNSLVMIPKEQGKKPFEVLTHTSCMVRIGNWLEVGKLHTSDVANPSMPFSLAAPRQLTMTSNGELSVFDVTLIPSQMVVLATQQNKNSAQLADTPAHCYLGDAVQEEERGGDENMVEE